MPNSIVVRSDRFIVYCNSLSVRTILNTHHLVWSNHRCMVTYLIH